MRSEKVSKPSVQKPKPAQPERPKTRTSATFALLRDADSALAAAQPKQAILLLERAVRMLLEAGADLYLVELHGNAGGPAAAPPR